MLRGSVEEILLRYRHLIDDAISHLKEDSEIDEILEEVTEHVRGLHSQEPSFWELRVVQAIHTHLHTKLQRHLRGIDESPGQNGDCDEAMSALDDVRMWLDDELSELHSVLQHPNQDGDIDITDYKQEHFADTFWRLLNARLEASVEETPEAIEEACDIDAPTEQASYEAISMDELQFEGDSMNSSPGIDEIPSLLEGLNADDPSERRSALQQLSQISALEITHSVMFFNDITLSLARRFTDSDSTIAKDSVRLVFDVLSNVEEPQQFLDLYLTVVDCIGDHLQNGKLHVRVSDIFSSDEQVISAIDVFRLLHELISRVPHHWIHFPPERTATVICGTLVLLVLDLPAQESRCCRVIDVLAVLDPMAAWCSKWILKVPSRVQLFVSIDETGFIAELLQSMSRVRPFEEDVDAFEKIKTANILSMLTSITRSQAGKGLFMQWAKLPAHSYNARRYQQWCGLPTQFRLDVAMQENERVFHFIRTDRQSGGSVSLELEDNEPLGELGLVSIVLASVVLLLCEPSSASSGHTILQSIAMQSFDTLSSSIQIHQEFCRRMLELCSSASQLLPQPSTALSSNEIEESDPWLPFRRARAMESIFPQIIDTLTKRVARGVLTQDSTQRRCSAVVIGVVQSMAMLSSLDTTTATALANCLQVYLQPSNPDSANLVRKLQLLAQNAQFSVARAFSEGPTTVFHLVAQLHDSLQLDDTSRDAIGEFVVNMAHSAAAVRSLDASGLWAIGVQYSLTKWQRVGAWDARALHLLSIPAAAELVMKSAMVKSSLHQLHDASVDHLDVALALNSSPSDAPFALRHVAKTVASLRGVLGTQYAAHILTDPQAPWTRFLEDAVRSHSTSQCQAKPQAEDRCTMAFDMVTALSGCVPSMVNWFDLLSRQQVADFDGCFEDGSLSACSFLATAVASASAHVGGLRSDWVRPHPVYRFDPSSHHTHTTQTQDDSIVSEPTPFMLTPHMTSTIDQMIGSIQHSQRRGEPLDMVMLSQATWELIGDVEKAHGVAPARSGHLVLTKTVAVLVYELAMSGQCKLAKASTVVASHGRDRLPSDAERKMLNRYYKDYCSRTGLKASPTLLHVLFKTFGSAASDCFPVSMLMVLDEVYAEEEIVALLEYCTSCRFIAFLWPRLSEDSSTEGKDTSLPALLPLAYAAEMILEEEYPQIMRTLRSCNCSVLSLALRWHSQCYWNYLPWDNILLMLYLNFLYGAEFQVYFFIAIIKHMVPTIEAIHAANSEDPSRAFVEIHQAPIEGFRLYPWRNLFLRLRSTYHDRIHALDS